VIYRKLRHIALNYDKGLSDLVYHLFEIKGAKRPLDYSIE